MQPITQVNESAQEVRICTNHIPAPEHQTPKWHHHARKLASIINHGAIRIHALSLSGVHGELNDASTEIDRYGVYLRIGSSNKQIILVLSEKPGTTIHDSCKNSIHVVLWRYLNDPPLLVFFAVRSHHVDGEKAISRHICLITEICQHPGLDDSRHDIYAAISICVTECDDVTPPTFLPILLRPMKTETII